MLKVLIKRNRRDVRASTRGDGDMAGRQRAYPDTPIFLVCKGNLKRLASHKTLLPQPKEIFCGAFFGT